MLRSRLVMLIGVFGSAAAAEPARMTGDDIRRVMQPGAVLAIDTPLHTSIPVTVAANGLVAGDAGALGLTLGALKDRGRWWVEGDQLCMKWFRWFDAKKRCISLRREANKVWWHEDSGEDGTATITEVPAVIVASAPPQPKRERAEVAAVNDTPPVAVAPAREREAEPPRQFAIAGMSEAAETETPPAPPPDKLGAAQVPAAATHVPAASAAVVPKAPEARLPRPQRQAKAQAPAQLAAAAPPRKIARLPAGKPSVGATSSIALVSFRVYGVEDGDKLNVRSGPSEYHEAVGAIPARGRGVQIVGSCHELWCPIRHGHLKGWVNRYYLAEDVVQQTSAQH